MAKIDMARRAEIGRMRRERTRSQILEAAAALLAGKPLGTVTVDSVVEAAGVAKGTFYYHFQSMDELASAVGTILAESFDEVLVSSAREMRDPIKRMSFVFMKFFEKAVADPNWARLVVQSSHAQGEFDPKIRAHLAADIAQAIAEGHMSIEDTDLAVDIVFGIWLQVIRGTLIRRPATKLGDRALAATLRALGVTKP
jgi:AcrR family transcriptional regulator